MVKGEQKKNDAMKADCAKSMGECRPRPPKLTGRVFTSDVLMTNSIASFRPSCINAA